MDRSAAVLAQQLVEQQRAVLAIANHDIQPEAYFAQALPRAPANNAQNTKSYQKLEYRKTKPIKTHQKQIINQ